jgi:hypothetical protein
MDLCAPLNNKIDQSSTCNGWVRDQEADDELRDISKRNWSPLLAKLPTEESED